MPEKSGPKRSLLGFLTREGRLRNRWAAALQETDPTRSAQQFGDVLRDLCGAPGVFKQDTMVFLEDLLHDMRVRLLDTEVLKQAEMFAERVASTQPHPAPPMRVYLRIIQAWEARGEKRQACDLAARAHNCPAATRDDKARIAQFLARAEARGDNHISIYIECLTAKLIVPEATKLLIGMFAVTFDSQPVVIKRAGEVAEKVAARQLEIPGLNRAAGLKCFVIDKKMAEAAAQFEAALKADSNDIVALIGVLAASLRNGKIRVPSAAFRIRSTTKDPLAKALFQLYSVREWFAGTDRSPSPPCNASDLEGIDWKGTLDETPVTILGRLWLIEHQPRRAAAFLKPIAETRKGEWEFFLYWADAAGVDQPACRIQGLRHALKRIPYYPEAFHVFWPHFLDDFLSPEAVPLLREEDFSGLRTTADAFKRVPGFSLQPTLERLLAVRKQRTEGDAVRELMFELYFLPGIGAEHKAVLARDLPAYGTCEERHVDLYLDHLDCVARPADEKAVIGHLAELLSVDLDSDDRILRNAGRIGAKLREKKISISGTATAIGLHRLLVERQPGGALELLLEAAQADRGDPVAAVGLAVAAFQTGDFDQLKNVKAPPAARFESVLTGLQRMAGVISWLDDRSADTSPPQLHDIDVNGLGRFAGFAGNLAIGRLKLIYGDARGALRDLNRAVESRRDDAHCRYFAAWASWLTGDTAGAVGFLSTPGSGSANPELDCLLSDVDPAHGVRLRGRDGELRRARAALAGGGPVKGFKWAPGTGTLAADLEGLRNNIGIAFASHDAASMAGDIARPLFRRLPLADQKMWMGLHGIASQEPMQGRARLEEAVSLGHPRASLALSVFLMQQGKLAEAKPFFDRGAAGRKDNSIAVLRSYLEAAQGRPDSVTGELGKMAAAGDSRARYVLGHVNLMLAERSARAGSAKQVRIFREQAAQQFQAAIASGKGSVPGDCGALARAAAFVADPVGGPASAPTAGGTPDGLDASYRTPWLRWNSFLIRLWFGAREQASAACDEGLALIEYAGTISSAAATAIAQQAARLAATAPDAVSSRKFEALIAALDTSAEVTRWREIATASVARIEYAEAPGALRPAIRRGIERLAEVNRNNAALAQVAAQTCLADGDRGGASRHLAQIQMTDGFTRRVCASLAALVQGEHPAPGDLPEIAPGMNASRAQACRVLQAAAAFAAGKFDTGCQLILTALSASADAVNSVIDAGRFLTPLCASAVRTRTVPPALADAVRTLAESPVAPQDVLKVARCAAVIGESDAACRLWEQAARSGESADGSQEYRKYLSHLAVTAWGRDDHMSAIRYLRRAGEIGG
jgi:hypothetical protein